MTYPSVAVVIIHWNKRSLLEQFLPSVVKSTYPNLKIYVADNFSSDDSVAWLAQNYPQIGCIKLDANYGYAGGYNRALQQITADYFVLLNNDVEVPGNWIEPVIAVMESKPGIAAAQPKILQYAPQSMFEYAGAAGGFMDKMGYVFCRGRLFEHLEEDRQQYNDTVEIFWASGACFFVKSAAFKEAGGFDEHFFAHMEEVDLCWRLKLIGYQVMAVGSSEVYHVGGSTLQKANAQKTYLNFRNSLIMLLKNLPAGQLWWFIFVRSSMDLLSSIYFLMNAQTDHCWAVHRAHVAFFFHFGKWFKLRKTVKRNVPQSQLTGIYKGSIVFKHFIQKKQTYPEL